MKKYSLYEYVVMIVAVLLILGLGGLSIWLAVGKSKERKEKVEWIKTAKACQNAPTKVDTIYDSIPMLYPVYIPLKPVSHEPAKPDTGAVQTPCTAEYADTYKFQQGKDFGRFRFKFSVKDCQVENMEISEAIWPKQMVIRTRSVDTCYAKPPAHIPRSHWGLFGGAEINSFKRFPGLDLNIVYLYKDKWGLYGGVMYVNPNKVVSDAMGDVSIWNNMYLRVGGMIYFK